MQPEKLSLETPNPALERLEQLRELLPEAFSEGKLDVEKLRAALGEATVTGRERYGLTWAGKSDAVRLAQQPTTATLRPDPAQSLNFDTTGNVIIEGENLEVLKLLQKAYHGAIKMIYIDPPYNTGNDFVYPDDFKHPLRAYLEMTGQSADGVKRTTKLEANGRFHSRWLSMMYPRLQLAKSLLRDDGVIFVSIDDHELQNLRAVMDEIFGEENFLAVVVWQKKYAPANDTADFSYTHEYLVSYTKNRKYNDAGKAIAVLKRMERTEEQNKVYKNPDDDSRGEWRADNYKCNKTADQRPNLYYPIMHPKTGEEVWPDRTAVWRYSKERHEENVRENRVWWGVNGEGRVPAFKRFLTDVAGVVSDTWWEHGDVGHTDEAKKEFKALLGADSDSFDTPKPIRLLERLLQLATDADADDIVLDFFAGSGTLGQAVLKANRADGGSRRFVMVQFPEQTPNKTYPTISSVTRGRVTKATEKMTAAQNGSLNLEVAQDLGFRAFTLSDSNFLQWDAENPDLEGQLEALISNVRDDRNTQDILWEILLKSGVMLSETVTAKEVNGQTIHVAQEGKLIVVLARPVQEDTMRGVMALKPDQVVCLDVAFEGNDALKTNIVLEMRDQNIAFRTV
jgi:adenine-specific DNA-methyltransferase